MTADVRIDALLPAEMARRAEYLGVRKAEAPLLALALAGALQRGGQIHLESEAGDGEQIVRSLGFREDHRLTWMRFEEPGFSARQLVATGSSEV